MEHAKKDHCDCIQQGGDSASCFSIFDVTDFGEDVLAASVQLMLQCISYVDLFCILEVFP